MSNRLFQSVIGQYRGSVDRTFGILDEDGQTVACSEPTPPAGLRLPTSADRIISGNTEKYVAGGFTFRLIGQGSTERYFVFVAGTDSASDSICAILAVSFANMKKLYDEKNDRASFIRNIILDNILPEEILGRARDLHMSPEEPRIVYMVRTESPAGTETLDMLRNMFPDRQRDFIVSIGPCDNALVKTLKPGYTAEAIREIAVRISDTFSTELYSRVTVGVSTVSESLSTLPYVYREALAAIEVSAIFGSEKNIAEYEKLGIGRLLYMLPVPVCEKYIREVFRQEGIDSLEPEILSTIQAFFDNSLNVSETSRRLFVHRNTLVYRLDKIQKLTGLDLRNFDDAITFRVALMVNRYLEKQKDAR